MTITWRQRGLIKSLKGFVPFYPDMTPRFPASAKISSFIMELYDDYTHFSIFYLTLALLSIKPASFK